MITYSLWDAFLWAMKPDRWQDTVYYAFWVYLVLVFCTTLVWGKPLFSIFDPRAKGFIWRNILGFTNSLFFTSLILYKFDPYHLFEKFTVFGYIL
ncbi:hypothetical protein [Flavobacterium sp.]|jgi:hypothetical protein|uniref:hypothetical protein n=1 Tax=Flavobacterium sp. TaxID=239 RepID=UPI0037BF3EE4